MLKYEPRSSIGYLGQNSCHTFFIKCDYFHLISIGLRAWGFALCEYNNLFATLDYINQIYEIVTFVISSFDLSIYHTLFTAPFTFSQRLSLFYLHLD